MNATPHVNKPSSIRRAADTLAEFRIIPRIETFPLVVSFAQTALGKVALLLAFGMELHYFSQNWISDLFFLLIFGLITVMPEYRRFILALTPIMIAVVQTVLAPLLLGLTLRQWVRRAERPEHDTIRQLRPMSGRLSMRRPA